MEYLEKLKERIKEKGIKKGYIANELGITTFALQMKLEGETEFKWSEILKISKILNLSLKNFLT